jgi:apolipoprotein D and lipocalin family protein
MAHMTKTTKVSLVTLAAGIAGTFLYRWGLRKGRSLPKTEFSTVAYVDLARYAGIWYEVARYPQRYERDCVGVTAEYQMRPDGKITVINSCRRGSLDGAMHTMKGLAWVSDRLTNARLKVQFVWPFRSDYWIFDLGRDYEHAAVGDPEDKALWILSRTPQMSDDTYRHLVDTLAADGHNVSRLVRTPQQGE